MGVDLNAASPALLAHVAGLNKATAAAITARRDAQGPFTSRCGDAGGCGSGDMGPGAGSAACSGGEGSGLTALQDNVAVLAHPGFPGALPLLVCLFGQDSGQDNGAAAVTATCTVLLPRAVAAPNSPASHPVLSAAPRQDLHRLSLPWAPGWARKINVLEMKQENAGRQGLLEVRMGGGGLCIINKELPPPPLQAGAAGGSGVGAAHLPAVRRLPAREGRQRAAGQHCGAPRVICCSKGAHPGGLWG